MFIIRNEKLTLRDKIKDKVKNIAKMSAVNSIKHVNCIIGEMIMFKQNSIKSATSVIDFVPFSVKY